MDEQENAFANLYKFMQSFNLSSIAQTNETLPVSSYISVGTNDLGIDNVMWYFQTLLEKFPKSNIVSLGSGNGVVERILCKRLDRNIVCIDSEFNKFIFAPEKFTKLPNFNTVDDYLQSDEKSNENMVLFINWPEPSMGFDVTKGDTLPYDYEAVMKLKPEHIIIVYDPSGASGSTLFINWIEKKCGVPPVPSIGIPFIDNVEKEKIALDGYHYVKRTMKKGKDILNSPWPTYNQILWLSRNKMEDVHDDFPTH